MPDLLDELRARCRAVADQATRITGALADPGGIDHQAEIPRLIDDLEHDYRVVIAAMRELAGAPGEGALSPTGDSPPQCGGI